MPRNRLSIYERLERHQKKVRKMSKIVKNYEGADVTLTDNPEKVESGEIIESFKVTVSTTDKETGETKVHYSNEDEPFKWTKVNDFPSVLKNHGGELTDDAIAFIGEALSGEANGKAIASLIEQENSVRRGNAKNNQYQTVVNKFKPQSEEDRQNAIERMAKIFSQQAGVTLETARKFVVAQMAAAKEEEEKNKAAA